MTLVGGSLLLGVNWLAHADEVSFPFREQKSQSGELIVQGALISSPCTLATNELQLPSLQDMGLLRRWPLSLTLVGCGEGGNILADETHAGRRATLWTRSILLGLPYNSNATGLHVGRSSSLWLDRSVVKEPVRSLPGTRRVVLRGGVDQLTWYLYDEDIRQLGATRNRLLRLRMDYE